jgi:RHS repeat-associated protein
VFWGALFLNELDMWNNWAYGFDQRIKKTAGDITTIYHYDQSGNLISESGEDVIDYIYLGNTRIAAVVFPTGECKGDLDNDGDVDGSDLAVFATDFGRTGCDIEPPCEGDFDHDNDVDGSDLAIFAGDFGRTDCPGEEIYYYHNDHLGTPQKMTDVNGAVVWSADYRPFGQADITVNTITNNFRFPGQYYDNESGLHYNWHRYYDPGIGRYLRADPSHSVQAGGIGVPYLVPFFLNTPQELNVYAYVQNDSVNMSDPFGFGGGKPNNSGYNYGDLCVGTIKRLVGQDLCKIDIDKWSNKIDNPCFICCVELIGSPFGAEVILLCEAECIAGIKLIKLKKCADECP